MDAKSYYEAEEQAGLRLQYASGHFRFGRCLRHLGKDWDSILDAGCGEGFWLDYVRRRRRPARCVGVELAENRAANARRRFPDVEIVTGGIAELPFPARSFEVVTCMQVLEHIDNWRSVVRELIRVSAKRVLITVPFRERIRHELCVHCHKLTPRAGHLHSYDRSSFEEFARDFPVKYKVMPASSPSFLRRLCHAVFRDRRHLAVVISVAGPAAQGG